jgi:ubiquitin fusion degradation protein 1
MKNFISCSLENALRNFATLTKDDVILIHYNDKDYELCVLETKPGNAVSIIECDMDVDFAPPVGYVEPQRPVAANQASSSSKPGDQQKLPSYPIKYPLMKKENKVPYAGEGYRLDGKAMKKQDASKSDDMMDVQDIDSTSMPRGIPNYDYTIGTLTFNRNANQKKEEPVTTDDDKKKPVSLGGTGYKLKHIGRKP